MSEGSTHIEPPGADKRSLSPPTASSDTVICWCIQTHFEFNQVLANERNDSVMDRPHRLGSQDATEAADAVLDTDVGRVCLY